MSGNPTVSFAGIPKLEKIVDALALVVARSSHRFVLAGGLGVMARLDVIARATNDIDAVTPEEAELIASISDLDGAGGTGRNLEVDGVKIDVLGVEADTTWPEIAQVDDDHQRLFVASHLWALSESSPITLVTTRSTTDVPVASARSLLLMKLSAYLSPHRDPAKQPSDALDVYHLLDACGRAKPSPGSTGPVPAPVADVATFGLQSLLDDQDRFRRRILSGGWAPLVNFEAVPAMVQSVATSLGATPPD